MRNLLILLGIVFLFYSCDEVLTSEQECEKTIRDTFENANGYGGGTFSDYNEANISLDSFKHTATIRNYVEAVCLNELRIERAQYNIDNGIICSTNQSCEEIILNCQNLLESQHETLNRKIREYTPVNYVIVHDFMRNGLRYKYRYFLNESYKVMSVDYIISQGITIKWKPIMCE